MWPSTTPTTTLELLGAIARESKNLAGEIMCVEKRIKCRVFVFDLVPRAMHSIWSALHGIVGGLLAVILSIELALAFDASVVFFTGPLCLIGCRRLMTPTEIDDERLRRRAAKAYYTMIGTFERRRKKKRRWNKPVR